VVGNEETFRNKTGATAHRGRGVWVQGSDESRTNERRQPDPRPLIERWKTLQRLHSPLLPLIAGDHWGDLQTAVPSFLHQSLGRK
jgi:hypothetical protein